MPRKSVCFPKNTNKNRRKLNEMFYYLLNALAGLFISYITTFFLRTY